MSETVLLVLELKRRLPPESLQRAWPLVQCGSHDPRGSLELCLVSPCPQVNLQTGVPPDSNNETCTAGAGSLLVEFGILSRLLGDSTFEWVARRAVKALWNLRSNDTGLLGAGTCSSCGDRTRGAPCSPLLSGAPSPHAFFPYLQT